MVKNIQESKNIVLFPIQRRETNELTSMAEDILQTRLVVTEGLNKLASGELVLSEEQKEDWRRSIHTSNEVFKKYGFSPIHLDF